MAKKPAPVDAGGKIPALKLEPIITRLIVTSTINILFCKFIIYLISV